MMVLVCAERNVVERRTTVCVGNLTIILIMLLAAAFKAWEKRLAKRWKKMSFLFGGRENYLKCKRWSFILLGENYLSHFSRFPVRFVCIGQLLKLFYVLQKPERFSCRFLFLKGLQSRFDGFLSAVIFLPVFFFRLSFC